MHVANMSGGPTDDASEREPVTATRWERTESLARILSWIAIPLVIALVGWWVQVAITRQSISKDYVALAIDMLEKPRGNVDPGLRGWAVDLLDANAPVRLPRDVADRLKSGTVSLAGMLAGKDTTTVAIAPDGRTVAIGDRYKTICLYDLETGRVSRILRGGFPGETNDGITALAFSPDSKWLFAASLDHSITGWDVTSGKVHFEFHVLAPVQMMSVSADRGAVVVSTGLGDFLDLDPTTGHVLWSMSLERALSNRAQDALPPEGAPGRPPASPPGASGP